MRNKWNGVGPGEPPKFINEYDDFDDAHFFDEDRPNEEICWDCDGGDIQKHCPCDLIRAD